MKTTLRTLDVLSGTLIAFHPNEYQRHPLLYNAMQIGHIVCGARHSISRTGYASFGMYSVTRGRVKLTTEDGVYIAEAGDFLFFDQNKKHVVENDGQLPYEADFAYVFGPNVKEFFAAFFAKYGCVKRAFTPPSLKEAWQTISSSILENREDEFLTSALLYRVLTEILQICGKEDDSVGIEAAIAWVSENYDKTVTLDSLAERVYLDKYYLIRQFRSRTGFTPKEYQIELRLQKAEDLLKTSSLSVAKIAAYVGFSDSRSFASLFRKSRGVSPSVFRLQQGQENQKD